jgi:hypothetical protein
MIDRDQYEAAMIYARLHALMYGKPWRVRCPLGWDLAAQGRERPEAAFKRAQRRLDEMNAKLTLEQRLQVVNVAVYAMIPAWFYAARGIGRVLEQDARDKANLIAGLTAIAG